MGWLTLSLLGGFRARLDRDAPLLVPAKARALLAYLAARPGLAHSRDKLAALLWGGTGQEQARSNLRQTLFAIRHAVRGFSPELLVAEAQAVALEPAAVDVDVLTFEKLVAEGTAEAFERAAALYQGDLLEGLSVDEPPFEEWLLAERERLRELALEALARLLAHQAKSPATERAIQTALRLLALDALQEPVHRTLMRLYARQGRRSTALKQYQVCVGVLRRELGAEPEPETRRLYQDILQQRVSVPAEPEARLTRTTPRARPAGSVGEGPLIGREGELGQFRRALDEIRSGLGRVVVIVGEAGVGKSRLVTVVGADAGEQGARVLLGRCYESQQILPFGPWVDALRGGGVSQEAEALQELAPVWRAELSRLLPEVSAPDLPAPSEDLPRLFESVAQLVERLAAQGSLVLVLEDLHWADDISLRLFAFVARRTRTVPALIVATAREEELAVVPVLQRVLDEVATEPHFVRMPLSALSRGDTAALVRSLARRGIDEALVARLSERLWTASEGNPFMIVETMRALDDGAATETAPSLPLPERVRRVIAGRLERLSQRGQQLAAVAAVIGREFEFPVLQIAAGLGVRDTAEGVEELVRRRVLHGIGERLDFTHERSREVVHGRLLALQRKVLHSQVAKAIEEVYAPNLEPHFEALGMHYRESQVWNKAALYAQQAGAKAITRSAYTQAVASCEMALEALAHLPETPETLAQVIDLRLDLCSALITIGQFGRALAVLRKAEASAATLDDQRRLSRILFSMCNGFRFAGEINAAIEVGQRALTIATGLGDVSLEVGARFHLGVAYNAAGEYGRAVELFTRNLDNRHDPPTVLDQASAAQLTRTYSLLGRFAEGMALGEEVVRLATASNHPHTLVRACIGLGVLYTNKGDLDRAISLLERGLGISRTWPLIERSTDAMAALGRVYQLAGRLNEALPLLEQAAEQGETTGNRTGYSWYLVWLSEGYLRAGHLAQAREHAQRAVDVSRLHKQRGPEAHALHALAVSASYLDPPKAETVEGHYLQALALAEELGMRPLVAHCHLGLGKLYRRTGKREQAQEHLTTATTMYREMGMTYWLEQAEAHVS